MRHFIIVATALLGGAALSGQPQGVLQQATPDPPKSPFETVLELNRNNVDRSGKIIDGVPAVFADNRWQVSLVITEFPNNFRAQFCGGIYLGERWVATAAHCAVQAKELFQVFYGSGKLDGSGTRVVITNKVLHPSYSRYVKGNDIALLEIAAPLPVDRIAPATPAEMATMKSGDLVRVTGWGMINDVGVNSQTLLQASPPLQTMNTCNAIDAYNKTVPADMLCAGTPTGGPDSCKGDSGGPATAVLAGKRRLIGIVSNGDGCGQPKRYGLYTRVSVHAPWIETQQKALEDLRPK